MPANITVVVFLRFCLDFAYSSKVEGPLAQRRIEIDFLELKRTLFSVKRFPMYERSDYFDTATAEGYGTVKAAVKDDIRSIREQVEFIYPSFYHCDSTSECSKTTKNYPLAGSKLMFSKTTSLSCSDSVNRFPSRLFAQRIRLL